MRPIKMRVDGISEDCDEFVTGLMTEALADADLHPDGFVPFGAVLTVDGQQWRIRREAGKDPQTTLDEVRSELSRVGDSARCVAVVWDTAVRLLNGDHDAVYMEVYELGRPVGHLAAMGYHRGPQGVSPTGQMTAEHTLTEPIVAPSAPLVRRHLDEWADECRADFRLFVQQLNADIRGFDQLDDNMRAFDNDPRSCGPLIDQWLSSFPFGELDTDDAVALLKPVAQYLTEVLVQMYGGRWDVGSDDQPFSHVIVIDGDDGLTHQVDPYAVVAEYADAPLPPVSAMLKRAVEFVHR
jgi:hypothetical protein